MKTKISLIVALFLATWCVAQNENKTNTYDSTLATKLGADQFGRKEYVMVMLNKGPVTITDAGKKNEIIRAHIKSMDAWTKQGKVLFSGPVMDNDSMQWMLILEVKTPDEAQDLINTDPGVVAGIFSTNLHLWYGPAALQEVDPLNKAVEKRNFL